MKPLLSIIIPCYNSESTLEETLISVLAQDFDDWEALIVNDGSPDKLEAIALAWVAKDARFKYFKKENGGLGSARNFGIQRSLGVYILPLDSDNLIRPYFFKKALNFFEQNDDLGVIYGNSQYFGERNITKKVGDFDKFKLLYQNYIDACALIKKKVFDNVGLYDTNLPFQGHEDWEFWIRVMVSKHEFFYLNETTFDYRVTKTSMIKSFNNNMLSANFTYVRKKHFQEYLDGFDALFLENKNLKQKKKPKSLLDRIKNKLREK